MADIFDEIAPEAKASGDIFDEIKPQDNKPMAMGDIFDKIAPVAKSIASGPVGMAVGAGVKGAKVFEKVTKPAEDYVQGIRNKVVDKVVPSGTPDMQVPVFPGVNVPVPTRPVVSAVASVAIPGPKDLALMGATAGFGKLVSPAKAVVGEVGSKFSPAVSRIMEALKEAKPLRGKQEAIYSAVRSKQAGDLARIGANTQGEGGFFSQLGSLKGAMPKVQFEGIRNSIGQEHIDELFNTVESNRILTPFEKVSAKTGLSKLMGAEGGVVPTRGELALLSDVFPNEFIKSVLDKKPMMEKLWTGTGNVLNVPRSVMASVDLSAPFRQGAFLVGRPKQWGPAFKDMFKYAFNEKAYQGLLDDIHARPTYQAMRESGLSITEIGNNLAAREEAFMSNLPERIPVIGRLFKGSNRAYSGFLNKLRADVFDDMYKSAEKLGVLAERPNVVDDIAKFVNSATGRGDMGSLNRAAVELNSIFFSPKLIMSRLNLLNPVYYAKLDPFVRKEALKSLLSFAGVGTSIVGLAKMGGADVVVDPRNADFGKIKVGNTRYDPWGGFQQYIVLASRLLTNEMISSTTGKKFTFGEGFKPTTRMDIAQRFVEGKTSPAVSFAIGMLRGKNSVGEKFEPASEVGKRFVPMMIQDIEELMKERGALGIPMAVPGVFGVGSQTYDGKSFKTNKPVLEKPPR